MITICYQPQNIDRISALLEVSQLFADSQHEGLVMQKLYILFSIFQ